MSQGFLTRFRLGHRGIRRLLNWWPPFRAAGIRVREHEPRFPVDIVDEAGVVVADVEKTLYIRRKNDDGLQALEPRGRRG